LAQEENLLLCFRKAPQDLLVTEYFQLPLTLLQTMYHQSGAVEAKLLNVKASRHCQTNQCAVCLLNDMLPEVVMEGMQDTLRRVRLPIVTFRVVAGKAAVDPVRGGILTATRRGLKVVNRQFRTHVRFADTAVGAAEVVELA
jgi:hypothetical protein